MTRSNRDAARTRTPRPDHDHDDALPAAFIPAAGAPTSLDELGDRIAELAAHIGGAERELLALIAEADRRDG